MKRWTILAAMFAAMPLCADPEDAAESAWNFLTCLPVALEVTAKTSNDRDLPIGDDLRRMVKVALDDAQIPIAPGGPNRFGATLRAVLVGESGDGEYHVGLGFHKNVYDLLSNSHGSTNTWTGHRSGSGGRLIRLADFSAVLDQFTEKYADANRPEFCPGMLVRSESRLKAFAQMSEQEEFKRKESDRQ